MRNNELATAIFNGANVARYNRARVISARACYRLMLILAVFMLATPVQAQVGAYSIQVAVSGRSDQEQQDAYLVGMRAVLLANSGDKTLLNRDDVRAGLRDAANYVESFRYETPEEGTVIPRGTPVTDVVRSTGQATQLMLIQFNPQLINQLILPGGETQAEPEVVTDPFSGVSSALLWMIVEDGSDQILIGPKGGQNVMGRAREIAGGASISLSFPAGDDTDKQAITVEDIQAANVQRVSAAASRYAQGLTLLAYLKRTRTGGWEGAWLKVAGQLQQNETFTSNSLDEALQLGIDWLGPSTSTGTVTPETPIFQSSVGPNTSSAEGLIWVSPLPSTESYARVMNFMSSVGGVSFAYPKEVLSGGVLFAVTPRNAVANITSAANSLGWLRQSTTPSSASESSFADGISVSLEYLR